MLEWLPQRATATVSDHKCNLSTIFFQPQGVAMSWLSNQLQNSLDTLKSQVASSLKDVFVADDEEDEELVCQLIIISPHSNAEVIQLGSKYFPGHEPSKPGHKS